MLGRNERLGLPGLGNILVKLVDLLQRKTLGLVDGHESKEETEEVETTPDEENVGTQVTLVWVNHVWSRVSNGPVPQPVRSGTQSDRLGSGSQWEQLTNNDPSGRTPSGSEEGNEDTAEGDKHVLGGLGVGSNTSDGNNQLGDRHTCSTSQQDVSSTDNFHQKNTRNSGTDVNNVGGQRDGETVNTSRLEEGSTEVENEVDTSQLLESLDENTGGQSLQLVVLSGEDLAPRGLTVLNLELVSSLDVLQLLKQVWVVVWKLSQSSKRVSGLSVSTLRNEESRSLRQQVHTETQDKTPQDLDGQWDSVRSRTVDLVGTLVNTSSQENTDGDSPLVTRDNGTSDPLRSGLGLVQRNGGGNQTNTQTSNNSTDNKQRKRVRSSLQSSTQVEDDKRGDNQTPSSTQGIVDERSTKSTNQGTGRQDGDKQRRFVGSEVFLVLWEVGLNVRHGHDTGNGTGIVTEKNTTEGGKDTDEDTHSGGTGFLFTDVHEFPHNAAVLQTHFVLVVLVVEDRELMRKKVEQGGGNGSLYTFLPVFDCWIPTGPIFLAAAVFFGLCSHYQSGTTGGGARRGDCRLPTSPAS